MWVEGRMERMVEISGVAEISGYNVGACRVEARWI